MDSSGSDIRDAPWVVKNTFLEFDDGPKVAVKRSNSASDLSTYSSAASARELKDWAEKTSSRGSNANSGCSTPRDDVEDLEACKNFTGQPPSVEAEELYKRLVALGGTRSVSAEMMAEGPAAQDVEEIRKHVPKDDRGASTSIGSIMHFKVEVATHCKPCIFWAKGRCAKGDLCLHCHFKHPNVQNKRLRASKATRERRAKLLGQIQIDETQKGYDSSNSYQSDDRSFKSKNSSNGGASSASWADTFDEEEDSNFCGNSDLPVKNGQKKEFKSGTIISL